ncbi:MAG: hypothetical protein B7Z60_05820 [Ferrovum sp. 37-45-19]|jgi:hypothetical protein|uniref:hypothetical protein n=1 Tax=Ferrovum sp. JA12 TaxID=1356299 RepID=UPI00070296E8|nr:hypothetical protein [Ferrovum sp. JA12]OYV79505.1 MAG: hypothetical protein B7Z65_05975 [Ferrovum sp. 21-44-67]OYV94248.1 MAG: hypothetical protein B7Z60_05820 [Ferrovum sp. 37-45-19]OZB31721.1 MAG: hypothetical protein B7X47_08705 [Ferrovum sp. 34-44-207]HQT81722.1 hypothetical protein [Ferrovaceae bacterium]KRH78337.1 hypothetical protein FERRO_13210 [Ferrovum sp. JA12]
MTIDPPLQNPSSVVLQKMNATWLPLWTLSNHLFNIQKEHTTQHLESIKKQSDQFTIQIVKAIETHQLPQPQELFEQTIQVQAHMMALNIATWKKYDQLMSNFFHNMQPVSGEHLATIIKTTT